jgi:hypothetical protein
VLSAAAALSPDHPDGWLTVTRPYPNVKTTYPVEEFMASATVSSKGRATIHASALKGMLRKPAKPVSIEAMNQAIVEEGAKAR